MNKKRRIAERMINLCYEKQLPKSFKLDVAHDINMFWDNNEPYFHWCLREGGTHIVPYSTLPPSFSMWTVDTNWLHQERQYYLIDIEKETITLLAHKKRNE